MFAKPYAMHYEKLNQKKPYRNEIDFVWRWAKHPKNILDLGCGTAHYWKYYPKGVAVLGVERSKDMIEASEHKRHIVCQDIMQIKRSIFQEDFDLATSLFDVINYLPDNSWWKEIPLMSGGYFIFDLWDKEKIKRDGFSTKTRMAGNVLRTISPIEYDGEKVKLKIDLHRDGFTASEIHEMFLYDTDDILEFAENEFELVDIKRTGTWQTWFKLKRK